MKAKEIFIVLVFAVVSLIVMFWIIPYLKQPVGVPLDFYDLSNSLNESEMDIYYIGESNPLNERVNYKSVKGLNNIPSINPNPLKAIILDFNYDLQFSENDFIKLVELYKDQCYVVLLIDYRGAELSSIIDDNDSGDSLILLDFTGCGEIYFSSAVEFPKDIDLQNTQYLITYFLEKKVDNN